MGPTPAPLMVIVLLKIPTALPSGSVFAQTWKVLIAGVTWNGPVRQLRTE